MSSLHCQVNLAKCKGNKQSSHSLHHLYSANESIFILEAIFSWRWQYGLDGHTLNQYCWLDERHKLLTCRSLFQVCRLGDWSKKSLIFLQGLPAGGREASWRPPVSVAGAETGDVGGGKEGVGAGVKVVGVGVKVVGAGVGSVVGLGVGLGVGLSVGFGVGLRVGFGVGLCVGVGVTLCVGRGVAACVGLDVGVGVGAKVGGAGPGAAHRRLIHFCLKSTHKT